MFTNNPEALAQLKKQAVALCQLVGVAPVLKASHNAPANNAPRFLNQLAYTSAQHQELVQWAHDRALLLAHLQALPTAQKEDALWGLTPCPLPLAVLVALLEGVNPDFWDDKNHQTYVTPVLLGLGCTLSDIAFQSLKALIAQYQLTTTTTPIDNDALLAEMRQLVHRFAQAQSSNIAEPMA